jgi:hypothetical protein
LSSYNHYKAKYHDTKPIRGRAQDTRPIGQRRRTWETIDKREINGEEVYVCHLYQTDCVAYYPDGSVGLQAGSWATPTTAEFMYTHSPFTVHKQYGNLWARVHSVGDETKSYPIPAQGELRLYAREHEGRVVYEPKDTIMISKRVVDRNKAKNARAKIQGFIDWAKSFNMLSDGWIYNDTREQYGKVIAEHWNATWDYGLPEGITMGQWNGTYVVPQKAYAHLQTCEDVDYMKIYLAMFCFQRDAHTSKVAKTMAKKDNPNYSINLFDLQFKWDYVKNKIYQLVADAVDVTKIDEVEVGSKAMTKVIG